MDKQESAELRSFAWLGFIGIVLAWIVWCCVVFPGLLARDAWARLKDYFTKSRVPELREDEAREGKREERDTPG
jgi:hypothetical protein